MARRVLLLGATGLFGGHLARALADQADITLFLAGRRSGPLDALAAELSAHPVVMDRNDPNVVRSRLAEIQPFAVVDCSGPFQYYGEAPYAFARAVIDAGAHYLDIADCAEFVSGISALDAQAKAKGVTAISGASTTPALSSAIASDLAQGLDRVDFVETTILPGNKTARGLSVMRAILGQVGARFSRRFAGQAQDVFGWQDTVRIAPKVKGRELAPRYAALVNTPDVALLPTAFGAKTVVARAGLELGVFHRTLSAVSFLRKHLRLPSPEPLSGPLLRVSNLFTGIGSDAGGMRVSVIGRVGDSCVAREWDMIIPDGHGPKTPVQPVLILLAQLANGKVAPGARAALCAFTRAQAEAQLSKINAAFERRDQILQPIFAGKLGSSFDALAAPVQQLHRPAGVARHVGQAKIETATSMVGKLAAVIGGFPLKGGAVPAEVVIEARDHAELWTRKMGDQTFRSKLTLQPDGRLTETFGPLVFDLDLAVQGDQLKFPVGRGRVFGWVPIPKFLTPISETTEAVDALGRFTFDVRLNLPNGALIVHYKGHLIPA